MNPDELRQEADRLARRGDGADAHIVRAAADAWQKDLDNWLAEVKRITASASAVEESLRRRLEDDWPKFGPDGLLPPTGYNPDD